ncbi:MAG: hypothetical protein A3F13_09175 [Gammaproteobacteria bacterium RIFCSPHIGHO2_12_FULL_40_19]|nr:MAG: hypothetical protein A3F13_09175 [Gammaproteobacteria bacterium RIFCSPHIGHO2_12_FULL_40_19]
MKNTFKCSLLLATTFLAAHVYAGGPTVEPMAQPQNHALFATLEGGYTWNYVGNTTVSYANTTTGATNTESPTKTNNGGSGRFALGAIHYTSNPDISYTGEFGWGYYGKTTFTTPSNILTAKNYLYGFDLLGGIAYKFTPMLDGFFKLGGLLENVRMVRNVNLYSVNVNAIENETTTVSSVIPLVKLGGIYNLTDCWGLSLAYTHAFGNSPSMTVNKTVAGSPPVATASTISSTGAPISFDNVMAGVMYKFA